MTERDSTLIGRPAHVPVRPTSGASAQRNRAAVARMTEAQRLTGMTAEELREQQARLRAEALRRLGSAA